MRVRLHRRGARGLQNPLQRDPLDLRGAPRTMAFCTTHVALCALLLTLVFFMGSLCAPAYGIKRYIEGEVKGNGTRSVVYTADLGEDIKSCTFEGGGALSMYIRMPAGKKILDAKLSVDGVSLNHKLKGGPSSNLRLVVDVCSIWDAKLCKLRYVALELVTDAQLEKTDKVTVAMLYSGRHVAIADASVDVNVSVDSITSVLVRGGIGSSASGQYIDWMDGDLLHCYSEFSDYTLGFVNTYDANLLYFTPSDKTDDEALFFADKSVSLWYTTRRTPSPFQSPDVLTSTTLFEVQQTTTSAGTRAGSGVVSALLATATVVGVFSVSRHGAVVTL